MPNALTDAIYRARVKELHGGSIWPTKPYTHSKDRIGFQCECGHAWTVISDSPITRRANRKPKGCPKCGIKKCAVSNRVPVDEYKERLLSTYGTSISLVGPFSGLEIEASFKCNLCNHEWVVRPRSLLKLLKKHARFGQCSLFRVNEIEKSKTCRECGLTKVFKEFPNASSSKDGKQSICRKCDSDEYQLTALSPELKANRDRIQKAHRKKPEERKRRSQYELYRLKTDVQHKLRATLRKRLYVAIKGSRKSGRTIELLGCSIDECKIYLELKFTRGMTWENHGSFWHIDHIFPLSKLDLNLESEQRIGLHFTNLQPLKSAANISKNAKITQPQMSLLL